MAETHNAIPRKGISEPSHAVHRSPEAAPASSHRSEHPDEPVEEQPTSPPAYSGPASPSLSSPPPAQPHHNYVGLPRVNYSLYSPSTFELSTDQTTISSRHPRLSSSPAALVITIQNLANVPPKPQIRLVGNSRYGLVDFDVKLNFMSLIVPSEERRVNKMNYMKIIGPGEMGFRGEIKPTIVPTLPDLEAWARRYCEDPSSIKQFVLERTVINWDTSYLEGRLLSLISSTSYRGQVDITFLNTHSKVIIQPPDKVNRFFSDVTKAFTGTRKYEVVKSVWPYADVARGEQGRKCAVQEEESWFADWKDAIRHAIMSKRHGWVTVEDQLEILMEPKVASTEKPAEWGN